jgi:ankyrin repeat protein
MINRFRFLFYLYVLFAFCPALAGVYEDFFRAVANDDSWAVIRLLNRGVDVNWPGPEGLPALSLALQHENFKVAETLLRAPGLLVDTPNAHGETALMFAALKGQVDWTQRLIRLGAQVQREGWTPLHYAASGPEPRVVAFLLDAGASIDARSPPGSTPLMLAARFGDERSVDVLLQRGADARLKNPAGWDAADFARMGGRDRLADRLARLREAGPAQAVLPTNETGK